MNSPILEALPGLHVTIIGVVAAFFSAFAIYAYQKVNDAKEKLEDAVKHCKLISTPELTLYNGNKDYLNEDRTLNWEHRGKEVLRNATIFYPNRKHDEESNIAQALAKTGENRERVISACDELCLLLSTIFITYPFWDDTLDVLLGRIQNDYKISPKEFSQNRIHEMQGIVGYLNWIWRTNEHSLRTLAKKGNEYSKQLQLSEQEDMFKLMFAHMPKGVINEENKEEFRTRLNIPLERKVDFESAFVSFFEKAQIVEDEVIPLLKEAISDYNKYNTVFHVKETTLKMIALTSFNMIFGVILPLITMELLMGERYEGSSIWFSYFEYCILISTMYPYLWACYFLYSRVKKLDFS
ncbi:hypothetical protein [Aeromonas veronii]|uniref:hypothetical protein n=1 Tax=Aeromonas veronii TaxID=654 RepID=UPI002B49C30D|nr:hypothetical protein [Aeromonas veronii]